MLIRTDGHCQNHSTRHPRIDRTPRCCQALKPGEDPFALVKLPGTLHLLGEPLRLRGQEPAGDVARDDMAGAADIDTDAVANYLVLTVLRALCRHRGQPERLGRALAASPASWRIVVVGRK